MFREQLIAPYFQSKITVPDNFSERNVFSVYGLHSKMATLKCDGFRTIISAVSDAIWICMFMATAYLVVSRFDQIGG